MLLIASSTSISSVNCTEEGADMGCWGEGGGRRVWGEAIMTGGADMGVCTCCRGSWLAGWWNIAGLHASAITGLGDGVADKVEGKVGGAGGGARSSG